MKKLIVFGMSALLAMILISNTAYSADKATELIKNANAKIATSAGVADIQKILEGVTAFETIADRVAQSVCPGDEKITEFKSAFTAFLKASYSQKLSKYKAEKTEYLSETKKGKVSVVHTKVKSGAKEIKIDYELEQTKSGLLIPNYIVDNINTVDSYKKQFKKSMKKDSIDKIIADLKKKTQKMLTGKAE